MQLHVHAYEAMGRWHWNVTVVPGAGETVERPFILGGQYDAVDAPTTRDEVYWLAEQIMRACAGF